jgi:nucleotide-binding universal stress UspA family protein
VSARASGSVSQQRNPRATTLRRLIDVCAGQRFRVETPVFQDERLHREPGRPAAATVAARNVLIGQVEANMIALKQILVATDFSEPADVAVNYGRDLAREYDATLHVIHVIENVLAFYGPDIGFAMTDIERNIESAVQRDLASTIAKRDGDPLKVVTTVKRASNAADAIAEYAEANAIDLIIVGAHGRGAVSRFLMGSVAERLVRNAPCPVLTVRAHERDFVGVKKDQDSQEASRDGLPVTNHH